MGRMIDADALIDKYGDWYTEEGNEEGYIGTIKGIVNKMPTIEERKKGKWVLQTDRHKKLYGWYICSECGAWIGNPANFCSECGADMRGTGHGT